MIDSQIQGVGVSPKHRDLLGFLSIAGVVLGLVIRIVQYLSNRSLWSDEAMLALNIVNRSYLELLKPLNYNQAAPPGFLWIEKLAVQLLGNNEYALRLFPFIAGIVSLIAFYLFVNRYATAIAVPIAIALFACLKYVVYYANEVKQYSSDVMVTLLLCLLLIPLRHQVLNWWQCLRLGLLGAAFIWLSHPTVLVLAAIEIGYFLVATQRQRLTLLINRLPMYLAWLTSFLGLYFFTIRSTLENESLTSSWDRRYPDSLFDIVWLWKAFDRFFSNPVGFSDITDGIAIFAFIVGCVALYRQKRMILLVLTAPIIITIVTSYLHQYPFRQRLVLFLVPLAIILIAEGIAYLLSHRWRRKLLTALSFLVFFTLLVPPVMATSQLIVHPTQVEEFRPVIAYVKSQQQPTDRLYVYRSGLVQFLYYAPKFGYASNEYVLGKPAVASGARREDDVSAEKVQQLKREIKKFKGSRVWFLFCNAAKVEENIFLSLIEPMGQQVEVFRQHNAFAYLYDLQ